MNTGIPAAAEMIAIAFALCVSFSAFVYFLDKGHAVAEAGTYGLMGMLMLQSWTAQLLLLAGGRQWQLMVQAAAVLASLALLYTYRSLLFRAPRIAVRFTWAHRVPTLAMGCGAISLAALHIRAFALAHTPASLQFASSHWALRGGMFSGNSANAAPAGIVMNHVILLAHWQPAAMAPTASLCAWLSIGLATYALARRYAWPGTSITVALLVVSMPRILCQALVPQSDLLPAAAAIAALLALFRAVEEPHSRDLAMLAAAIGFTVAGSGLCYLLPAVLLLLSLLVLGRRHQLRLWPAAVIRHPMALSAALAALLVFSQIHIVWNNLADGHPWIGALPGEELVFNTDGIAGTAANLVRYLLQTLHLPDAVDRFFQHGLGFSPLLLIQSLYQKTLAVALDGKGAAAPFSLSWARQDPLLWFGPTGFFLCLPAVFYAMRKGPRRLKNTVGALTAYWVLIALILAWRPQHVSLMTPFFVCSGFSMAFFLPPWRISRNGRAVLQLLAVAIGAYTLMP